MRSQQVMYWKSPVPSSACSLLDARSSSLTRSKMHFKHSYGACQWYTQHSLKGTCVTSEPCSVLRSGRVSAKVRQSAS